LQFHTECGKFCLSETLIWLQQLYDDTIKLGENVDEEKEKWMKYMQINHVRNSVRNMKTYGGGEQTYSSTQS